jgi:heptosyltransferase-2
MDRSVLLIKIGALGDVIMALHAVYNFRRAFPAVEISWLVGSGYTELVKLSGLVDDIIEAHESKLFGQKKMARIAETTRIQWNLNQRKYDVVAIGNVDYRYRLLAPIRSMGRIEQFGFGEHRRNPLVSTHSSVEYFKLLAGAAVSFPLSDFNYLKLPGLERKSGKNCRRIMLFPGGAKNYLREDPIRRWPIDRYVSTAKRLLGLDYEVVVAGGKEDTWVIEHFKNLKVDSVIGKTSLLDVINLIQSASAVVAHDSGPLHLATLTNTPIVALFGPVDPRARILSSDFNGEVVWNPERLVCAPCFDGRNFAACRDNRCISTIEPARVVAAIQDLTSKTLIIHGGDQAQ